MKGIIWTYTLVIFIMTIISSTIFLNNYYYQFDLTSNGNKRAIVESLEEIATKKLELSTKEVIRLYEKKLDANLKHSTNIHLLAYQEDPYALRIRLINKTIPFVDILSDETVIAEEKDG